MAKVHGPCAYERCEALHDEELVADPCTVCRKPVHHFCSNSLLDGELDVRVCSVACRDQFEQASGPANKSSDRQPRPASTTSQKMKRKRRSANPKLQGAATPKPRVRKSRPAAGVCAESVLPVGTSHRAPGNTSQNPHISTVVGLLASRPEDDLHRQHMEDTTMQSRPTVGAIPCGLVRRRRVHDQDGEMLQQILNEADSDDEHVVLGEDQSAKSTSDVEGYVEGITSAREPAKSQAKSYRQPNSTAKTGRKKKKFFFTQEADLALLKEILSVEPYAAEHGDKASRYQLVADNLSEHLGVELQGRTVKGRMKLLLAEFEREDQSYRKKSGVSEVYSEHKRLLQDIKDRIQAIEDAKMAKKQKKSNKSAALQTQGEFLREQAVKRRSEREFANSEGSESDSSTDQGENAAPNPTTSTLQPATTSRSLVNSAGIVTEFMEDHAKTRAENKEFQNNLLSLKKEKAEQDAKRWEEEMVFKRKRQEDDKQKWNEEYQLRKEEMQLRRDELRFMREQFEHQKSRLDSAQSRS